MHAPMWVVIWLQVYGWVELLDRAMVLVPGWLDLPLTPTRFLLSTLLSTLGIGKYAAPWRLCACITAPAGRRRSPHRHDAG
eukprot:COSAG06_NODE_4585_length_4125_cov_57.362146_4_plen_81_part_00